MTSLFVERTCPLCRYDTAEVLFRQMLVVPEELPLDARQTIVCCDQCGFVYADVTSYQENYDRFYAQFSKYADQHTYMGGGGVADVKRLQQTAAYLVQKMPDKHKRILDIGCANGTLLGAFQQLGYTQLCGIDLFPACIQTVIRKYGIEAHPGSLSNFPPGLGQFDLIILSHVLEHVKDIREALQYIHTILFTSGYVYIEVPDASRYADFVFSPLQEFNIEHINHFSQLGLKRLLTMCGFCVIDSGQKMVESAPNIPSPTIFVTAVKKADLLLNKLSTLSRDEMLRKRIQIYIDTSQQLMAKINFNLKRILKEHQRIIVWGTGQLVMKLLAETVMAEAAITAFVDSNPILQGQSINGIPILAPVQIIGQLDPIVVSSTLYYEDICKYITEEMKLPNTVIGLL
jgi:SAM-dependent methyltransferase